MAMMGIAELKRVALEDTEMARAFAIDAGSLHDGMTAREFAEDSFERSPAIAHGDPFDLPGVRLVKLSR